MTERSVEFTLIEGTRMSRARVAVNAVVIAGWTGRDPRVVEQHIAELEALGVKRPASVPVFYRVSAARLNLDEHIEVLGEESSGEVEVVLLQHSGRLWVGVGSDHTDRHVETYNISVSKQMCDKPIGREWWFFDEVAAHWNKLRLRSYIRSGDERVLYQEGGVAAMLEPAELIARFAGMKSLPDGTLMFCGTLAALGGVRAASLFQFELEDPVLHRTIRHSYHVRPLPLIG